MTKKSKHYGSDRELMVGANQHGNHAEWASELQTERFVSVGFVKNGTSKSQTISTTIN
jgi:hypothetical protein